MALHTEARYQGVSQRTLWKKIKRPPQHATRKNISRRRDWSNKSRWLHEALKVGQKSTRQRNRRRRRNFALCIHSFKTAPPTWGKQKVVPEDWRGWAWHYFPQNYDRFFSELRPDSSQNYGILFSELRPILLPISIGASYALKHLKYVSCGL